MGGQGGWEYLGGYFYPISAQFRPYFWSILPNFWAQTPPFPSPLKQINKAITISQTPPNQHIPLKTSTTRQPQTIPQHNQKASKTIAKGPHKGRHQSPVTRPCPHSLQALAMLSMLSPRPSPIHILNQFPETLQLQQQQQLKTFPTRQTHPKAYRKHNHTVSKHHSKGTSQREAPVTSH